MGLRLHNTLTRTKQDFVPIDAANVRMYVCGPTVYDFAHIGNARPLIVFDVLFRLLRHIYEPQGGKVTYVRNITDVDDKINARAAEEYPNLPLNDAIRAVTEKTEAQFHEDARALGCLTPTHEPRATDHIVEMKAMVDELVARDFAYVEQDHALFRVAKMKDYGRLSNRALDDMIAGARVEVAPYKRDPMDFVLWKPSKPGEPAWPSPAGIKPPGRPGWHLECSAMSDKWLWTEAQSTLLAAGLSRPHEFDIHGGGIDLLFPHHENEVAQSRCAHGTDAMANYWLHNGFLQVEGEKMSKSLGNFVTIDQLLNTAAFGGRAWTGEVLRFAMLKTHYRQPIDWTVAALREAEDALTSWAEAVEPHRPSLGSDARNPSDAVVDALSDDLNTAAIITEMHSYAREARRGNSGAAQSLASSAFILGLNAAGWHGMRSREAVSKAFAGMRGMEDKVEALKEARNAARKAKDFAEADRIRKELDAMGIALKDAKDPKTGEFVTIWEIKR